VYNKLIFVVVFVFVVAVFEKKKKKKINHMYYAVYYIPRKHYNKTPQLITHSKVSGHIDSGWLG
jgi:hypothetical protein